MRRTATLVMFGGVLGLAVILAFVLASEISIAQSRQPVIEAYACAATTTSFVDYNGTLFDAVPFDVEVKLNRFYALGPDLWQSVVTQEMQQAELYNTILTTEGTPDTSLFTLTSLDPDGEPFFPAIATAELTFALYYDGAADTLYQHPTTPFIIESVEPLDYFPQDSATYRLMDSVIYANAFGDTVIIDSGTVTVWDHRRWSGEPIPSLTEWGAVLLCVLLLCATVWVVVQRRKRAHLRA